MKTIKRTHILSLLAAILCFTLLFSSCGYSKKVTDEKLATIEEQISSIKTTLPSLEATSTELGGYIDTLEATAAELETKLTATNTALETVKTEIYAEIDAESAALLAQLTAEKDALAAELAKTNKAIEDAKADNTASEKELTDKIAALENIASSLNSRISSVSSRVSSLTTELNGKIADSEQKVLDELNSLKTDIEGQLATINNAIVALQAKDDELDQKIANLQTYVDNELTNYATTDWATAAFATLQMYQETQETIAGIELNIKNINDELKALETRINNKIATDIEAAVDALRTELKDDYTAKIEAAVEDITSDYKAAIQTARNEIEAAYKAAIETAVASLKTDMQNWVNEQLEKSLDEIAALRAALETLTAEGDAALQKEIDDLKAALEKAESDLTAVYEQAIKDAVADGGVINAAIAAAVNTAQDNLQAQIDAFNSEIAKIKARLDIIESDIRSIKQQIEAINGSINDLEELFDQIQSVTFIPQYSDGKVLLDFESGTTSLDFMINPQKLNADLVKAWEDNNAIIKAYVRYTEDPVFRTGTRAVATPIELTVADVTASDGGIISITVEDNSPSLLSEDFWLGKQEAVVYIVITDGVTEIASEVIPLVAHSYVAAGSFRINGFANGEGWNLYVSE